MQRMVTFSRTELNFTADTSDITVTNDDPSKRTNRRVKALIKNNYETILVSIQIIAELKAR